MIFGNQLLGQRHQISGRLPVHIENLIARSDVVSWIGVAVHAPAHLQTGRLNDGIHLVNLPMTGDAGDPFIDVRAMVEIDEIGERIDPIPDNGLVIGNAVTYRSQHVAVGKDF